LRICRVDEKPALLREVVPEFFAVVITHERGAVFGPGLLRDTAVKAAVAVPVYLDLGARGRNAKATRGFSLRGLPLLGASLPHDAAEDKDGSAKGARERLVAAKTDPAP
jgi:hypothetical protein